MYLKMSNCVFCNNKLFKPYSDTVGLCYNHLCDIYFILDRHNKEINMIYYYYLDNLNPKYKYIIDYYNNTTKVYSKPNRCDRIILNLNTIRLISPENLEQTIELINGLL